MILQCPVSQITFKYIFRCLDVDVERTIGWPQRGSCKLSERGRGTAEHFMGLLNPTETPSVAEAEPEESRGALPISLEEVTETSSSVVRGHMYSR